MPFSIYSPHIVTAQIKPKIGRRHFFVVYLIVFICTSLSKWSWSEPMAREHRFAMFSLVVFYKSLDLLTEKNY